MNKRLKQLFGKKERAKPIQPFSITILFDPATENYRWSVTVFGSVPFPLIYEILERCRDDFKLKEAAIQTQALAKGVSNDSKENQHPAPEL